jgi:subtilisin family serine protease
MERNRYVRAAGWATSAMLAMLALSPVADAADGPSSWLVGTSTDAQAAARGVGERVAPGIRLVHGDGRTLSRLRHAPGVRWIERNRVFRASGLALDPLLGRQWALGGRIGMRARRVWQTSAGSDVTVAVLDSGVRLDHPDLAANLWTNPGEIAANGVDDDADGWVDDVHGANVVSGGGTPDDGFGHGTAVAGVIGARGGNARGISGVAPRVRLQPVKVLDDHGVGSTLTVVEGMRYALAHGARVINVSLNGPQGSQALEETIAEAEAMGVLVVASAGNDGQDRDRIPSYPASTPSEAIISVTSVGRRGYLARGAAYGAVSVDLAAPGTRVLTTTPSGYGVYSGTSFAAAHVSGALALMAAARPDAPGPELRRALIDGARRSRVLFGLVAHGRLNTAGAIARLVP